MAKGHRYDLGNTKTAASPSWTGRSRRSIENAGRRADDPVDRRVHRYASGSRVKPAKRQAVTNPETNAHLRRQAGLIGGGGVDDR